MARRLTWLARACVVGTLVLALGGCLRYHVDLSVSADQRVSGTVVVAIKTTDPGLARRAVSIPADLADRVTSTHYDQDGYLGQRITLRRLTFGQVARLFDEAGQLRATAPGTPAPGPAPPTPTPTPTPTATATATLTPTPSSSAAGGGSNQNRSTFTFRRDGDLIRVSGETSFPVFAFGGAGKDFDARITLTFPGDVVSTNGRRDGHTVTWRVSPNRPTRISAAARIGSSAPAWLPLGVAGGGAVAVLLVGLLVVSLVRRRRAAVPAGAAPVFDAAEFQTFLDDRSWYPSGAPGPADPGGVVYGAPPPQPRYPQQPSEYPQPGPPPPGLPGYPGYSDHPGHPGHPGQLGQPGQPAYPQQPAEPGGPGQPPQSGQPHQPGQSGQWPPPYPETPHR